MGMFLDTAKQETNTGELALYRRVSLPSIPALDGIRALSVLLVILSHLGVSWASGAHGVMAFFVLSGFLITWLLLKESEVTGRISLRSFYARRTLRIFPAFYVFWITYVVLTWLGQHRTEWPAYISAFFYVSNYYSAIVQPPHMAMAHTWSLAVEEQFYLLWPWVFRRFRNQLPRLSLILCCLIVGVWTYRLIFYASFHNDVWLFCAFDCRADHLAVGCLTAVLVKRRAFPAVTAWFTRNPAAPLITVALLAGSMRLGAVLGQPYQFTFGFIFDPLLMAVLMLQWIALSDTPAWKWLDWSPTRYLGRVSYSAYLYHWIVDYALNARFQALPLPVRALAAVAGSNLCASISYYVIEKPFLRLKKRFEFTRVSRPRVAAG
jgi:peptidoglycan/LPS O-acetylase OafA/YrhL